jgi:hypothetical protein
LARIIDVEIVSPPGLTSPFAIFIMEVQRGGGVGNMVSRRYSEFVKLHRLLLASHPAQYVPPLI